MRDSKKAIITSVAFVLLFALLSTLLIEYNFHSDLYYYYDLDDREQYKGKIDCLFLGGSLTAYGISPDIIDRELGCHSYNLSGAYLTLNGRYELLCQEIDRNSIDTMYIELSYKTLSENERYTGILYGIPRIPSFSRRVAYGFGSLTSINPEKLFDTLLLDAKVAFDRKYFNGDVKNKNKICDVYKGWLNFPYVDVSIPPEEICKMKDSVVLDTGVRDENMKYLGKIIDLCKTHNIKPVFIVIPNSDKYIWKIKNRDEIYTLTKNVVESYGYEYIDFNLYKGRYELLSDKDCFKDSVHMSGVGSERFSETFTQVIKKKNAGEDVSDLFYSSYEEMKEDSPYMEYYKAHCND